ncbi:MAG: NAD(P)-dependent alcohol dehydrogenase [Paracoccaceae bacterium]
MISTLNGWSVQRYGGPETLTQVARPLAPPTADQVMLRIKASAVTRADTMMRRGEPRWARAFLGFRRPRKDLSGVCLSGEVVAVGSNVTRFSVGDDVFGEAGLNFGANANHICLDANSVLLHKPSWLSHQEAAVLCDGVLTSYNFLVHIANVKAGENVLILGASGSLGTAAVQIGAAIGAQVTGVCSAQNTDLVTKLGAAHVIDYAQEDFTKQNTRYDVIFDTLGIARFSKAKSALSRSGRYVCPVLSLNLMGVMLRTALVGRRKASFSATGMLPPDTLKPMLNQVLELIKAGQLTPVIDRSYPLQELVEAHRYVEGGHKRGNVVLV